MGRNVMLKEFVARVVLVLLIVGLATEAAPDESSDPAKQPAAKDPAASTPSEPAN